MYHLSYWLETPSPYLDYLFHTLPFDESIMEFISLDEMPWKDQHHRSSILPNFHMVKDQFATTFSSDIVTNPQPLVLTIDVDFKGNLSNITKTISIDISVNPRVIENINIG